MITASEFYKWLKIFGVQTGGSPPPPGALLAVNNLSDVQSINTSVNNLFNNLAFTTIYVSNFGVDAPNRGNQLNPYQTLSYALSQIIDNSSTKFYQIKLQPGVYTETNLVLKPWIYLNGSFSNLTVSGTVSLDAGWSGGGSSSIENFKSLSFPSSVTLDFSTFPSINFNMFNCMIGSNFTINFIGNPSAFSFLYTANIFGSSDQIALNVQNFNGAITNGATGNVNITNTSGNQNFSVSGISLIGNFSCSTSSTSGLTLFHENGKCFGTSSYSSAGSGTLSVLAKNITYFNSPTIDKGLGGGNVSFTIDLFNIMPTLLNGAIYAPTSLANSVKANITPANYTPVDPSVSGNLMGIDNALGSGISPDLEQVYANGSDAVVELQDGRPISIQTITSAVDSEAVATPSTGINTVANFRVLGWTFTVNNPKQITALQYDDSLFTGSGTRQTGIYDKLTQELLAEVFISKTDPLVSGFRTTTLSTPLTVSPAVEYVFATVVAGGESNHTNPDAVPGTGISITETAELPSSLFLIPLSFPQSFNAVSNTVFVGSFLFNVFTIDEEIDFNDVSSNPTTFLEVKSVTRSTIPIPPMTTAQRNAIGVTNFGSWVFVNDVNPKRPYVYDGTIWQGVSYLSDFPTLNQGQLIIGVTGNPPVAGDITSPAGTITKNVSTNGEIQLEVDRPVPALTQGQFPIGVLSGAVMAGNLVSLDGSIQINISIDQQINLQSVQTLQQAYDNGNQIILNNTSPLTIKDSTSDNSIEFNGDGSNPLMRFNGTTNSTIPYAVLTDAQFASFAFYQGILAYTTTSNRLSVYDGMSIRKIAYLDDFNTSGTFIPTITNVSGLSTSSVIKGMYNSVGVASGNMVTCSLQFSCTVSATLVTVKLSSLPVSPNTFSSINNAMSNGGFVYNNVSPNIGDGQILDTTANVSANDVNFSFLLSNTTGTKIVTVTFSYIIQ